MSTINSKIFADKKIVLLLICTAVIFTLLSFGSLWLQAKKHAGNISGQIISVTEQEIVLENKHGSETTLIISEDTRIRGEHEELEPGMFIHSFGERNEDGEFISEGIRVLQPRR